MAYLTRLHPGELPPSSQTHPSARSKRWFCSCKRHGRNRKQMSQPTPRDGCSIKPQHTNGSSDPDIRRAHQPARSRLEATRFLEVCHTALNETANSEPKNMTPITTAAINSWVFGLVCFWTTVKASAIKSWGSRVADSKIVKVERQSCHIRYNH